MLQESFGQHRDLGQHHLYLAQFFISASKLVDRQQLIGKDRLKFCCNIHSYKFIWEILEWCGIIRGPWVVVLILNGHFQWSMLEVLKLSPFIIIRQELCGPQVPYWYFSVWLATRNVVRWICGILEWCGIICQEKTCTCTCTHRSHFEHWIKANDVALA